MKMIGNLHLYSGRSPSDQSAISNIDGALKYCLSGMDLLVRNAAVNVIHRRCAAHVLNLITKDGLAPIQHTIAKIRAIVKKMRKSSSVYRHAQQVGEALDEPVSRIPKDVSTRWNSTYLILERFVMLERFLKVPRDLYHLPTNVSSASIP